MDEIQTSRNRVAEPCPEKQRDRTAKRSGREPKSWLAFGYLSLAKIKSAFEISNIKKGM